MSGHGDRVGLGRVPQLSMAAGLSHDDPSVSMSGPTWRGSQQSLSEIPGRIPARNARMALELDHVFDVAQVPGSSGCLLVLNERLPANDGQANGAKELIHPLRPGLSEG